MPRPKSKARILKSRGKYCLFFTDYTTGKSRRIVCESLNASNKVQRDELVRQYRAMELTQSAETLLQGGPVTGNSILVEEVEAYLERTRGRGKVRESNPEAREGLAASSVVLMENKIGHFIEWLKSTSRDKFRSKDLSVQVVEQYVGFLTGQKVRYGKDRTKSRSAATINVYKRNLKACLKWIHTRRPRRFIDFEPLLIALKPTRGRAKQPVAYSPEELNAFLEAAIAREDPNRRVEVKPTVASRKNATHSQPAASAAATPVSRLFLLLAFTGCRAGEALALRWDDVDLKRGRIAIMAAKTTHTPVVPLLGDPAGDISSSFAALLECWWQEDPKRQYVLPHGNLKAPRFPKGAWYAVDRATEARRIVPQKLRQNFTSYAASLGIPASVAAMWQGHSADVAEKHYRAQVLERNANATNFEDAMGLSDIIKKLIVDT